MSLGLVVAQDIANAILIEYTRGRTLSQTTIDKPTMRRLRERTKPISAGNRQVSDPVQGTFMADTAGFYTGYTQDDVLTFQQAQNILRTFATWYETHAGLIITMTELKENGITILDNQQSREHTGREVDILTDLLENRVEDFNESWNRMFNLMLWKDGTQDSKQPPGIASIIIDDPTTGTTMGLNRATYWWWQNRALTGSNAITPSPTDQNLTRRLRSEIRQLGVFGGRPDFAPCGSEFMDALELEYQAKGLYTQSGFTRGTNDMGMDQISIKGVGNFVFDPTLDQLAKSKKCYFIDTRRLRLRPMKDEDEKLSTPSRPYNYMVWLRSMTWTGAIDATQLNCHAVYEVV